jgi:hypothetical protein
LYAVRTAAAKREAEDKFDWSKTWVAEMFLSGDELKRRKEDLERQRGITPEVKRLREIKAGIITASAGIGVSIFLYVLMQGIISSGRVGDSEAEILSRIWVSGVIPVCIGIGLVISGLFFSGSGRRAASPLENDTRPETLRSSETSNFIPSNASVTEGTTKQLRGADDQG